MERFRASPPPPPKPYIARLLIQHDFGFGPEKERQESDENQLAGGLSAVHREYLAAGGMDFLIGDGRLNYELEYVWESFYSARLVPGFYTTFDVQRDTNPAYNRDRGPVTIYSIRMHIARGLKPWLRQ